MLRRTFVAMPAALWAASNIDLSRTERGRVLKHAQAYLKEKPVTVTAASSPRSAGGPHDFFSEGDYWWPDPKNPDGPYIQRDGMTNPDNFLAHRRAMVRLSLMVPALTAAWQLTYDRKYAEAAAAHVRAWFVSPETRMNPSLLYSQAIKGRFTGRGIGIIDTLHLVEVARALSVLEKAPAPSKADLAAIRQWFEQYVEWMTTHKYGIDERNAKNNHGTCWVLQVAEFARFTRNTKLIDYCRDRYKTVLLPNQMGKDGSFPLELARTKPYGYSLFNLDVMSGVCQSLSDSGEDLWKFTLPDGRTMSKAVEFMAPFVADKSKWPYKKDVMYWDDWPVRHPSLLFGGLAAGREDWISLWSKLNADPEVEEIIRNFPIRQPLLWVPAGKA
jgi:Alginate lyase